MKVYHMPDHTPRGQYAMLLSDLLSTKPIQVGEWQAMDVSKSDLHKTYELEDVTLHWERLPASPVQIMPFIDLEWADEHFDERVGGKPLNPAPSHERWPYAVRGNSMHTDSNKVFDHTYPERFWPKGAGRPFYRGADPNFGIRFRYGDLNSVADLLTRSPLTRQAFLPVWFPEDTGAEFGQRVPCTIGYHFMQRGGRLSCRYYLRSCEVYRHLSNDAYFAHRLTQWLCDQVWENTKDTETPMHFRPGSLTMHITSLHAFVGDKKKINDRLEMNHAAALHDYL